MVSYASGSVRIPGLSGNDTDFAQMIVDLKKIETRQVSQLLRWKSDWQQRLDAFKELRGELMNMQTALKGLNSMDKFYVKSAASSDEKKVTATAASDAINTSYNIQVKQLATNSTWTKDTGLYKKDDVICADGGEFTYTYKGKTRTVTIPKNTTAEGLIRVINNDSKNPGVRAQLIQSTDGIAFQLRGMATGKANTLVIRETTGIPSLGVTFDNPSDTFTYNEEAENKLSLVKGFDNLTDKINETGENKTFIYTVDGIRRTVTVEDQCTLDDLLQKINTLTPGVASAPTGADGKLHFTLERQDTVYSFAPDPDDGSPNSLSEILGHGGGNPREFGSDNDTILSPGDTGTSFTIKVGSNDTPPYDKTYTVPVDDELTLRGLANSLQAQIGNTGTVKIVHSTNDSNKWVLQIEPKTVTHRVSVENGTLEDFAYVPPSASDWDVSHAVNAQVRVNNYPSDPNKWAESASNTLRAGEFVPGVTFHLNSVTDTDGVNIAVATDTSKIEENIVSFVDAVNSFRSKLMQLTKYDETKEVYDVDYAESQFEMQKGSVLTGNYGVQTIESRLKSAIAGSAIGFLPVMRDTDNSILSGDLFSALSQIGITTNAAQGEATYGLLEINQIANNKGSKSLQQALEEDPEAVAKLFACNGEGKSNSDDFHYNSHLHSITKPGTYSVSYRIESGQIVDAMINGRPALVNQETGVITANGDHAAKGLAIDVGARDEGQTYTGSVSIKSGKINEILDLLEGTEGILGTGGTLRNLEKNYQGIIDGIDTKIQREDERIQKWEKNMILRFARLEGVLANYSSLQKTLESQLAQLSTGK